MKKKILLILLLAVYGFTLELQKANIYNKSKHNVKGWYMSEKLDGIRAYWNGKTLLSKNANKIYAPKWFIDNLPPFELDGELWTKRGDFENIQNIVLDTEPSETWGNITYNIFEIPNKKGDISKRLKKLKEWLQVNPSSYIKIVPQVVCKNENHLEEFLKEMLEKKAEGVMLKNPFLEYESIKKERSNNLLKVKTFFDDEAIVISHNYKDGRLKSLVLKLENGKTFNLGNGFSIQDRLNPPKVGETVTFKYYGFTKNGKPKFASFLRVRKGE
jgi:DNA ligase-1